MVSVRWGKQIIYSYGKGARTTANRINPNFERQKLPTYVGDFVARDHACAALFALLAVVRERLHGRESVLHLGPVRPRGCLAVAQGNVSET